MLRFQRDRLYIGLEPQRLSLVRLTGTWRPSVVSAGSFESTAGVTPCFVPEVLQRELVTDNWRGTRAQIVLADSMVRYFVAPLPSGARNLREIRLTAQMRFEAIFGDDAKEWLVEISPTPFATHHLACAIRMDVIESIKQACKEARIPLNSIAPFGIHEYNRNHRRIGHRSGWIAVIGPRTLWTAFKHGRNWQATHVHHLQASSVAELPSLLARKAIQAGVSDVLEKRIWVSGSLQCDTQEPWLSDPATCRLDAATWPGQSNEWSQSFRLALSPVWPVCA